MLLKFLNGDHYLNFDSWRKYSDDTPLHYLNYEFKLILGQRGMVMYGGLYLQLYVQGDKHQICPSRCHQALDPLAPSSVEMATKWLRKCTESHDECRVRSNPAFLPSRLIDVGHSDQSGDYSVLRLVETREPLGSLESEIENEWQYVTLSHCWGKSTHLSTTIDTLNEMKNAIPFGSLNKTYADANNATFNIAAAAAIDGDSGFLTERFAVKLSHVLRPDKETVARTLWIRPCIRNSRTRREDENVLPCPLFDRAWVLQESILAARTLAFSPVNMQFLCRMSQKSDENSSNDAEDRGVFVGTEHTPFSYLALQKKLPQFYFPRAMDACTSYWERIRQRRYLAFTGTEPLTQNLLSSYYPRPGFEPVKILWDATLIDADIAFVSDRYGPVKGGSITMKAHLLKIDIVDCFVGQSQENVAVCNGREWGTFYADCTLDIRMKYWALLLGYEGSREMVTIWRSTQALGAASKRSERKICLGLILMETRDDIFERVAYFERFDAIWPSETREVIIQ
ncbi:hypothetical protein SBOR_7662 [Sclerotinia borealis F-4128]|uniref:Heterokaryon incompatibility domain-containing protein n=1 Tax=Sclerotinia borealis (strain F-4128) TaxID=1432307 RepID=W9C837_SCLBF|nr:hypothetical protein SBOR_7662 [Sclerotinia borealis F-4128]